MSNMKLWNSVCVTDPKAVKAITGKQYKGNSPKPYWIIQRATETFGPCGIGWGIEVVSERFERFGDEALHIALVRVWFVTSENKRGVIEQMGQTKAAYTSAAGKHIVDEDAPKKSVTDGMVKCLSMLGFAGDIFSGQWDDSRYVEWAAEETERREAPKPILCGQKEIMQMTVFAEEVNADLPALFAWLSKTSGRTITTFGQIAASEVPHVIKALESKKAKA